MHLKKVKLPAVGLMILPGTLVLELLRVVADLRAHMILKMKTVKGATFAADICRNVS